MFPRGFGLPGRQLRAGQPPRGTVDDGGGHLQIAQQFGAGRGVRGRLSLHFEKQLRLLDNALAHYRRAIAPGGIELRGLPRIAMVPDEDRRQALAGLQAHARHRHQKLHGHVRREAALAYLLLDRLRQQFHQRQAPRHPTHAAVKPPRQLVERVAEALLEFLQKPALFQCALLLGEPQRAVQQQSFGFAQRPDHRLHGVAAQLLQRRHALVAVDDQVTVRLAGDRHHHDGRLLPAGRQRGQQPPLAGRRPHPQMLPAPIELVKLQLHDCLRLRVQYGAGGDWSCSAGGGSAPGTLVESAACRRIWSFAERTRSVPISPRKSAPWAPNWSFATSQGSRSKGAGKRSGSGGRSRARRCSRRWPTA